MSIEKDHRQNRQDNEMNNKNYPKFYRQRFILTLLKQAGGFLSKMDLQKLLFLSHKKYDVHFYDFVPYHYGCYSFQAASDLVTLHNLGWLKVKDHNITLLDHLPIDKGLKKAEKEKVLLFMRKYEGYRGRDLVRYIYEEYPYFAIKSSIAQDVVTEEAFDRIKRIRSNLQGKEKVLYTIGYEERSFEEYVNLLLKKDIRLLCDVRKNPLSRKFGFSKKNLSNLLPQMGIKYLHIPALGITSDDRKKLKTDKDYNRLFSAYKKEIPQKKHRIFELCDFLDNHSRIALTCFEKKSVYCHRRCISDYIERERPIKVSHL